MDTACLWWLINELVCSLIVINVFVSHISWFDCFLFVYLLNFITHVFSKAKFIFNALSHLVCNLLGKAFNSGWYWPCAFATFSVWDLLTFVYFVSLNWLPCILKNKNSIVLIQVLLVCIDWILITKRALPLYDIFVC